MKLLIIRHGDPDYSIDSLTEKGWREAEFLAERLAKMRIDEFYTSPLGRAKDTASCTLKKLGRTAVECEWLKEFSPRIRRPDNKKERTCAWDWLPEDWTGKENFYDYDKWHEAESFQEAGVREEYQRVTERFDKFLEEHGYVREKNYYRAERPNKDTVAVFCHFGLGCVLLSRLLRVSPMILWHGFCAAPTSVTTVVTEERRRGKASFRMSSYGDISHLYAKDEEPAFAARFCEIYDDEGERHD